MIAEDHVTIGEYGHLGIAHHAEVGIHAPGNPVIARLHLRGAQRDQDFQIETHVHAPRAAVVEAAAQRADGIAFQAQGEARRASVVGIDIQIDEVIGWVGHHRVAEHRIVRRIGDLHAGRQDQLDADCATRARIAGMAKQHVRIEHLA